MGFYRGPKIPTDALIVSYDAGNIKSYPTTGTSIIDLSSNSNNGTINGGFTYNDDIITLNGSTGYIDTGYGGNINPYNTPISLSMWIKPNSIATNIMFLSTGQGRGNNDTNQRMYLSINNGNWDWGIITSLWGGGNVNADLNWNNIIIVIDSVSARFYLNSVHIYTKSVTNTYVFNDSFHIGKHDNTYYFNGSVSDFKLYYNKSFSGDEIQQIYNATKGRYL